MKKGFTLAEVLITLGIIGVVAAVTLPIIIGTALVPTNGLVVMEILRWQVVLLGLSKTAGRWIIKIYHKFLHFFKF